MVNIVIDTNVFISALTSRRGASFKLLSMIGTGYFNISVSVPLVLEYEDVAKRLLGTRVMLPEQAVNDVIDYVCAVAQHHRVYYLWRPVLRDPRDDLVLELAVVANCQFIVTYNVRDFKEVHPFGVQPISPKLFLEQIGA